MNYPRLIYLILIFVLPSWVVAQTDTCDTSIPIMEIDVSAFGPSSPQFFPGEQIVLTFNVQNFIEVVGFELNFAFDPTFLCYVDNGDPILNGANEILVNPADTDNGFLRMSWNGIAAVTLPDGDEMFSLTFTICGEPNECTYLELNENLGLSTLVIYQVTPTTSCILDTITFNSIGAELCAQCVDLTVYDFTMCRNGSGNVNFGFNVCGGTAPYTIVIIDNNTGMMLPLPNDMIDTEGGNASINNYPLSASSSYEIRITDAMGNQTWPQNNFQLTPPSDAISATISTQDPVCNGSDGQLIIDDFFGAGDPTRGYSVIIDNGYFEQFIDEDDQVSINVAAGSYTVTVSDSYGCEYIEDVEVFVPPIDTFQVIVDPPTCFGASDGKLTVIATGGTPFIDGLGAYEYNGFRSDVFEIDAPAEMIQFSSFCPREWGVFPIEIKDANGCFRNFCVEIPVLSPISFTIDSVPPVCIEDGYSLRMELTDPGNFIYTYRSETPEGENWCNGGNWGCLGNGLQAGTHSLTIEQRDPSNPGTLICATTTTFEIPESNLDTLKLETMGITPDCGAVNGSAAVEVTGGVDPYLYEWADFPSESTNTVLDIPSGQYVVTVTDDLGCVKEATVDLEAGNFITAVIDTIRFLDCSDTTLNARFEATVTSSFDQSDLGYEWQDAAGNIISEEDFLETNIPGTYILVVYDLGEDCSSENVFVLSPPPSLDYTIERINPSSCGMTQTDASIEVITTQGVVCWASDAVQIPPFYKGNVLPSFPQVLEVLPGSYYITVTDPLGGCERLDTIEIFNDDQVQYTNVVTPPTCVGNDDGSIAIMGTLTGPALTAEWAHGPSGLIVGNLESGTYEVTITDENTCSSTVEIFVPEPDAISLLVDNRINTTCYGGDDGQATAIIVDNPNNTADFNFVWSNSDDNDSGGLSDDATALTSGENWVYAFDDNACSTDTFYFSIMEPDSISLLEEFKFLSSSCVGICDAFFPQNDLSATGGTLDQGSYVYDFEDTTIDTDALCPGTYPVTITDDLGCTGTDTIYVSEPDTLFLIIEEVINIGCNNSSGGGSITLSAIGGCGDYSYEWSGQVSTTEIATDLDPGSYTITVTDSCQCSTSVDATIDGAGSVSGQLITPELINCLGGTTSIGIDTSSISGGNGDYVYNINNTGNGIPVDSLTTVGPGTYFISLFDSDGCGGEIGVFDIPPPDIATINLGSDLELELGEDDFTLGLGLSNPATIDTIIWTPAESVICLTPLCDSVILTPVQSSNISVTVIDENGCEATDDIDITLLSARRVYRPNMLLPSSQINNRFMIQTGQGVDRILDFIIYDRWGNTMYRLPEELGVHPTSRDDGWDGRKNGRDAEEGVYVYIANIQFLDGEIITYKGHLTLIR